ncbi:hypothetical protein ACIBG7_10275 [Nonomuraea sp. NPDC050328]|uniref:hypothetical protein n=1 Tax=Nonomuraea sp. NPDC050328 TaxID=3364361 RepID=UPI0037A1ECCD
MILISAGLVLTAIVLLIAGFVLTKPFLIMWSIVVCVLSALFLVIGAFLRRHELFPGNGRAGATAPPVKDALTGESQTVTTGHPVTPGVAGHPVTPGRPVPQGSPVTQTLPSTHGQPVPQGRPAHPGQHGTPVQASPMGVPVPPGAFPSPASMPSAAPVGPPYARPAAAAAVTAAQPPGRTPGRPQAGGVSPDALVIVIPGRKRYHVAGCRLLVGRDTEELTYEEAREEGFSPCTTCLPDAALGGRQLPPVAEPDSAPSTSPASPASAAGSSAASPSTTAASAAEGLAPGYASGPTRELRAPQPSGSGGGWFARQDGPSGTAEQPAEPEQSAKPGSRPRKDPYAAERSTDEPVAGEESRDRADEPADPPAKSDRVAASSPPAGSGPATSAPESRAEEEEPGAGATSVFRVAGTGGAAKVGDEREKVAEDAAQAAEPTPARPDDTSAAAPKRPQDAPEAAPGRAEGAAEARADRAGEGLGDSAAPSAPQPGEPAREPDDTDPGLTLRAIPSEDLAAVRGEEAALPEGVVKVIVGTRRYHTGSCPLVKGAGDAGVETMRREAADAAGLTACSVCQSGA